MFISSVLSTIAPEHHQNMKGLYLQRSNKAKVHRNQNIQESKNATLYELALFNLSYHSTKAHIWTFEFSGENFQTSADFKFQTVRVKNNNIDLLNWFERLNVGQT